MFINQINMKKDVGLLDAIAIPAEMDHFEPFETKQLFFSLKRLLLFFKMLKFYMKKKFFIVVQKVSWFRHDNSEVYTFLFVILD